MQSKEEKIAELRKVQIALKDMLAEIVGFLDENGIKYYMAYGALLGTVRHKGCIPWDSDVDLFMFWEDANKLWELREKVPAPYSLYMIGESLYGGELRITDFAKGFSHYIVREKRTVKAGISIDVFILDYAKSRLWDILNPLRRWLGVAKVDDRDRKHLLNYFRDNPLKKFYVRTGGVIKKMVGSEEKMGRMIYHLTVSKKQTERIIDIKDPSFATYRMSWFGEGLFMPYEDMLVRVPCEYDKVLRAEYGDYMVPPPEKERETTLWDNIKAEF